MNALISIRNYFINVAHLLTMVLAVLGLGFTMTSAVTVFYGYLYFDEYCIVFGTAVGLPAAVIMVLSFIVSGALNEWRKAWGLVERKTL